ncbi:MAG: hypothetical protein GY705_27655 [Bacteroidetes bacterium]|nr:hypothetical protein [Bacteroidota bacterium]
MKIPSDVKKRMDILKGRKTYAEYLDSVLSYFEMTGVDPVYGQLPPVVTIVKTLKDECSSIYRRIEDVIKINRNIETNKIDPMLRGIDSLLQGKREADAGASDPGDVGPSEEEMIRIIEINDKQEEIITKLREESRNLKSENNLLRTNNSNKAQEIVELVEELLSDKTLGKDGVLTKEYKTQLFQKIRRIAYV